MKRAKKIRRVFVEDSGVELIQGRSVFAAQLKHGLICRKCNQPIEVEVLRNKEPQKVATKRDRKGNMVEWSWCYPTRKNPDNLCYYCSRGISLK